MAETKVLSITEENTIIRNNLLADKILYPDPYEEKKRYRDLGKDVTDLREIVRRSPPVVARAIPVLTWQRGVTYALSQIPGDVKNPQGCILLVGHHTRRGFYEGHYSRKTLDWFYQNVVKHDKGMADKYFTVDSEGKPSILLRGNDGTLRLPLEWFSSEETRYTSTIYTKGRLVATKMMDGTIKLWVYGGTQTASPSFELWNGHIVCVAKPYFRSGGDMVVIPGTHKSGNAGNGTYPGIYHQGGGGRRVHHGTLILRGFWVSPRRRDDSSLTGARTRILKDGRLHYHEYYPNGTYPKNPYRFKWTLSSKENQDRRARELTDYLDQLNLRSPIILKGSNRRGSDGTVILYPATKTPYKLVACRRNRRSKVPLILGF